MERHHRCTFRISIQEKPSKCWWRRKEPLADSIDQGFFARGWQEKKFATQIRVDQNVIDSPTHKVDCSKNGVGVEIEWNNKTEFYDRDLQRQSRYIKHMQTLIIEVSGGVIQEVYTDSKNLRVVKID